MARATATKVGELAPALELPDTHGTIHTLPMPEEAPATVVVWTCNHCPYALAWHDRIVQAARHRDVASDLEAKAVRRVKALEGAHAQVVAAGRQPLSPGLDLELAGLGHLELEMDVEGRRQDVVAGTQVC